MSVNLQTVGTTATAPATTDTSKPDQNSEEFAQAMAAGDDNAGTALGTGQHTSDQLNTLGDRAAESAKNYGKAADVVSKTLQVDGKTIPDNSAANVKAQAYYQSGNAYGWSAWATAVSAEKHADEGNTGLEAANYQNAINVGEEALKQYDKAIASASDPDLKAAYTKEKGFVQQQQDLMTKAAADPSKVATDDSLKLTHAQFEKDWEKQIGNTATIMEKTSAAAIFTLSNGELNDALL